MTMYTLPNFCRVCLKYDKNLIDLEHIENEPSETLMSKLQHCVAEVEWTVFKPLLCHPCIKRLNVAYTFKKQCVQSATVLKSYVALVKETKNKEPLINIKTGDANSQNNAYMMLPNQKYIKIVVGPQKQNAIQNLFLNVVPSTTISPVKAINENNCKTDNNNQNVLLNINNTFQKYVPIAPLDPIAGDKDKDKNVNQLLTEIKSEELSVEIDPTDFNLEDDERITDEDVNNDWEELISSSQISDLKMNGNQKFGNYVPILPKTGDDKINEFLNSGQHFLSSSPNFQNPEYTCESCQKSFFSVRYLKQHIVEFHMGKFPYQCSVCYQQFALRKEYENCMKQHADVLTAIAPTISRDSLTLKDFKEIRNHSDEEDYHCELCFRQFNSAAGLLRHKVRKHNEKNRKKYFIKGMKNAKCDICNREFSTQSYMQLHRKLHLRDDIGYKYKVFGKSKYSDLKLDEDGKNKQNKNGKDEDQNSETDGDVDEEKKDNQELSFKDEDKMDSEENDLVIDEDADDDNMSEQN